MDAAHCQRNLELPGRQAFRQTSSDYLDNINRRREEPSRLWVGWFIG